MVLDGVCAFESAECHMGSSVFAVMSWPTFARRVARTPPCRLTRRSKRPLANALASAQGKPVALPRLRRGNRRRPLANALASAQGNPVAIPRPRRTLANALASAQGKTVAAPRLRRGHCRRPLAGVSAGQASGSSSSQAKPSQVAVGKHPRVSAGHARGSSSAQTKPSQVIGKRSCCCAWQASGSFLSRTDPMQLSGTRL